MAGFLAASSYPPYNHAGEAYRAKYHTTKGLSSCLFRQVQLCAVEQAAAESFRGRNTDLSTAIPLA